jgi:redox-sensitive bicupin YhaK (pirin superfamily)
MNLRLYPADQRGHAQHGWLESYHSFSFASYYNPKCMHFGALRVLNDDWVAPGMGFGTHPHDNMEIISIPLSGDLEHRDSMGNRSVIKEGEIQVMSAGTGITHSEYNPNADREVRFLQIWLFPRTKNVTPRYDQKPIADLLRPNELSVVLSPHTEGPGVWIHQDAWFSIGEFDHATPLTYHSKKPGNGAYLFVLEGSIEVEGQRLGRRDAIGVWNYEQLALSTSPGARLLLMDVPMQA